MSLLVSAAFVVLAQGPVTGPPDMRLDSVLEAAAARGFHGVVLVAQRGDVILSKGYGFANHAAGTRFSPSSLVQIGSNVKDMTMVAVFQLVEAGRLRLTDSLPQFFQGVPADKRGITVEQLMAHRSGLPLGAGGGDVRPLTHADMLRDAWALQLLSPPGTAERYSNLGYALLAAIVEQLGGQPFDRYVAEHILRPAGMTETGSHAMRFDPARIAHGYQGGTDRGTVLDMPHDETGHLYQLRGNGGYLSTLTDMRKFYQALRGTTLLRDEAHRNAVVRADEPGVFAGSDLVSFFLFGNFPGAGVEIFIATNHAEFKGNQLLEPIQAALGIRRGGGDGGGERVVVTGPLTERLPDTGPGRTVAAYFEAFNTGDTVVMRRFFEERAASGPNSPPMSARIERYRDMFANLRRLTIRGWRQSPDGEGIMVIADGAGGETVSLTFLVEQEAPFRLRGMRVEVG